MATVSIEYFFTDKSNHTRLMGIDFGTKKLGIAISDSTRMIASPRKILKRNNLEKDLQQLADIIKNEEIGGVVIGMPFELDGSIGRAAAQVESFADRLSKHVDLPISLWDERFSTRAASRVFEQAGFSPKQADKSDDMVAASFMLQGALDFLNMNKT
jgi:putative Holliday junction resolvase